MTNQYDLTVTFTCPLCRKETRRDSTVESDSVNLQGVAAKADYIPRVCAFCGKVGKIELGDRIRVNPL